MIEPENPPRRSRQKHISTACDDCRQRRGKCNGQSPCIACIDHRTACVYSHRDRRRCKSSRATLHNTTLGDTIRERATHISRETRPETALCVPPKVASGPPVLCELTDGDKLTKCGRIPDTNGFAPILPKSESTPFEQAAVLETAPGNGITGRLDFERLNTKPLRELQGRFRLNSGRSENNSRGGKATGLGPSAVAREYSQQSAVDGIEKHVENAINERNLDRLLRGSARRRYPTPGYTRFFGNLPFSNSISANGYSSGIQMQQMRSFSTPQHLLLPLLAPDDAPLGRALTDFQSLGRRLIARGAASSSVADQGPIDVTLFFRDRLPTDPMNASTWTAEMLRAFRGTFPDELLLACAGCVSKLLRWMIMPTREAYTDMPAMIRPTDMQRLQPHPPWVDLMMFPSFRDALTQRSRDWAEPCMEAEWSILWSRPLEEAMVQSPGGQRITLRPEFVQFVDNPGHWSMRKSILSDFPEIAATEINILPY